MNVNSENWNLQIILSFIKNVPSRDELCLAGYTQSSVPGELKLKKNSELQMIQIWIHKEVVQSLDGAQEYVVAQETKNS